MVRSLLIPRTTAVSPGQSDRRAPPGVASRSLSVLIIWLYGYKHQQLWQRLSWCLTLKMFLPILDPPRHVMNKISSLLVEQSLISERTAGGDQACFFKGRWSGNLRVLWKVGWMVFCWGKHVKERFVKVDMDVKAKVDLWRNVSVEQRQERGCSKASMWKDMWWNLMLCSLAAFLGTL